MSNDKIAVENVNIPGRTSRVDAAKYWTMWQTMLQLFPRQATGLTRAKMRTASGRRLLP